MSENCKSIVLQDKCNIEIFLSPVTQHDRMHAFCFQAVTPLKVVITNSALRLRAILDFDDELGEKRTAGDEWLFEGPGMCQV